VSTDPIDISGGNNTYLYVNANPSNDIDIYGLYDSVDVVTMYIHYCSGEGTSTATHFSSINWGDLGIRIEKYIKNNYESMCVENIYKINELIPAQTAGADRYIIGQHNVRLEGEVQTHCDCSWVFTGKLSSFSGFDLYNMNRSNRRWHAELATTAGRELCKPISKPFKIYITGSTSISISGEGDSSFGNTSCKCEKL